MDGSLLRDIEGGNDLLKLVRRAAGEEEFGWLLGDDGSSCVGAERVGADAGNEN